MDDRLRPPTVAVPDIDEYTGMLLDEWDTQIAAYVDALRDAFAAHHELTTAREAMAVIEAEIMLTARGRTDAERRALTVLALRAHSGRRAPGTTASARPGAAPRSRACGPD